VLSEQKLDRVTASRKRKRKERGRGSHAPDGVETTQLMRDHGHAASGRHR
jgi:hypothetical protein